jgi:hypothetical protein
MTAAAKPGQRDGRGTPDCNVREEGGATQAAAVAPCDQLLMQGVVLVGVPALRSPAACRF